jgi:cadmium resistance protein CadD (predicted permease)
MISILSVPSAIGIGISVFAVTNVDDLCVLTGFFADRTMRPRAVVAGQVAGISALTLVSVCAALLALKVPAGWLGLIGLAPLFLGTRGLLALWKTRHAEPEEDDVETRPRGTQWVSVALVTIANGGDNVGVYVPLFAQHGGMIPLYVAIFAVMTGMWCGLSHWLVHHRVLGTHIRRYGRIVLPFVLIVLGLNVLYGARVLLSK